MKTNFDTKAALINYVLSFRHILYFLSLSRVVGAVRKYFFNTENPECKFEKSRDRLN